MESISSKHASVSDGNAARKSPALSLLADRSKSYAPVSSSLRGKCVAMVTFSQYPADPRPRRAADALLNEGASVDLICLADGSSPKHEKSSHMEVMRLPIDHRRGG